MAVRGASPTDGLGPRLTLARGQLRGEVIQRDEARANYVLLR